jgi:hypothetical protein
LMANRLWWAACVLVGVIVLVEVAAVALWLLNHYPASRATTTTVPRVERPQPLSREALSPLIPLSLSVTCEGSIWWEHAECVDPGSGLGGSSPEGIVRCLALTREAVTRSGCRDAQWIEPYLGGG